MLINECDAIINRRLTNINSSTDLMSNAVQNIFLEEMEKFSGICFLVSNYSVMSIDESYERRIIKKLVFNLPSATALKAIWESRIKLTKPQINYLVESFGNMVGGNIDNVVKLITMDKVVNPKVNVFEKAVEYCAKEVFYKNMKDKNHKRIGF